MTDFRTGELTLFPTQFRLSHLHRKAALAGALALSCCLFARIAFAKAAPGFGNLRGIIRSAQGTPLPGAQVRVHCANDNTDRSIVTNDQGAYLAENLRPARYKLVATKDGMNSAEVTTVDLQPLEELQVDMILYPAKAAATAVSSNVAPDLRPPDTGKSSDDAPLTAREKMLLERLDRLEQRLETMEANQAKSAAVAVTAAQPTPPAAEPKTTAATTPAAPVPTVAPAMASTTTVATAQPAPVTSQQSCGRLDRGSAKARAAGIARRCSWNQVRGKALGNHDSAQQASGDADHACSATRSAGSPGTT